MSTTLLNCEVELSKQMGDYWASTTTSGGSATTLIDTALMAKENDWVNDLDACYDMITEGDYDEEERKIVSLDNSDGTLTVLDHGGVIISGIDYRIHRLFSASDKRTALVHSAKKAFPHIHKPIWDETKAIDSDTVITAIDISGLGLAQNQPHQIWQSQDKDDDTITWQRLRLYTIDGDGNLCLKQGTVDYDLRIIGIGYLDFVDSGGTVGTDWSDDSIAIDAPQLDILIAEAAIYLCMQKILPQETTGTSERWKEALGYWAVEGRVRKNKFGMTPPYIPINYGV